MKYFLSVLLFSISILCLAQSSQTSIDITVNFKNLESSKGEVFVQLFGADQNVIQSKTIPIKNKTAQITFTQLPQGSYAIRAFHDANNNGEMDTNWIGIPKEPYGFSNNVRGSYGPPDFQKQLFKAKKNTAINIQFQD